MSTKIKTLVAMVVVAVILGGGFWWFNWSSAPAPEKVAQTSKQVSIPAQAATPKLATPIAQVELPKAPVVSASDEAAKLVIPASTDPQADLKTAIPDILRMIRADELLDLRQTYSPPSKKLEGERLEKAQANEALRNKLLQTNENPVAQQKLREMDDTEIQYWEPLESQSPTLNVAGDEATYSYTQHGSGLFSNYEVPMTFIKINGKWYLKIWDE